MCARVCVCISELHALGIRTKIQCFMEPNICDAFTVVTKGLIFKGLIQLSDGKVFSDYCSSKVVSLCCQEAHVLLFNDVYTHRTLVVMHGL